MHRQLPRPEQVQLIDALPQAKLLEYLRSSLALLSASTEEGFDYPVLEAKAEGTPTLISDIPVHREFHQDSSLFFPVDDDGGALADHVIACLQDRGLWMQLSQGGYALARVEYGGSGRQHRRSVPPALQNHLSGVQPIQLSISWAICSSKCSSIWRLMRRLGLMLSSLGQKL